jgi:RNA polymerase sigma factor (sigma-70 family)
MNLSLRRTPILDRLYKEYRQSVRRSLDDETRYRWLAAHILPCEGEVRLWLQKHVRSLRTSDHDDLIQEAYARIWEAEPARISNARGYFFSIVRNLLIEQARRARIVPMERMGEIESLKFVSDEPGPEQRASARQELENLCRIIAALPARMRNVFNLRSFEGYSRREIAAELGISERTVEKQLQNAHMRIDDALTKGKPVPMAHTRKSSARNEDDASK